MRKDGEVEMGLTERHWFEDEDVPENYERALEDAVYNLRANKKADMVEVVRCKDCRYCKYPKSEYWCEQGHLHGNTETWFCADGKRGEVGWLT